MNAWFRLYSEFATDPKVQMMSEAYQRRFIMLLCIRCGNDHVTLQDEEVAFQLRISNEEWAETKAVFFAKNLINEDNTPAAWDKRQFRSDSSAERVAKHRAKKKEQAGTVCNVTVTPPDTDTDTDKRKTPSESKETAPASPAPAPGSKSSKGSRLPADWQLPKAWGDWAVEFSGFSAERVRSIAERFADHWRAKPGKDGCKLDWSATWRNWIREEVDRAPKLVKSRASSDPFAGAI